MVIQRWQSVFLLVATLLMAFYAFTPVAGFTFEDISYELTLFGAELSPAASASMPIEAVTPQIVAWPLFVLAILIVVLSAITIFKYKQLKLQKTLSVICIILVVALVASLLVLLNGLSYVRYYFSNCMPILAVIAYIMAIKGISKDQKILSDADRLR